MNRLRARLLILTVLVVISLGAALWKTSRKTSTNPLAGGHSRLHQNSDSVIRPPASPSAATTSTPSRQVPPSPPSESEALVQEVVKKAEDLAQAQDAELVGISEADTAEALSEFAKSHAQALDDIVAAHQRLERPPQQPTPLPGADMARARFEAVRRAVIDDGLSLEEAESAHGGLPDDRP